MLLSKCAYEERKHDLELQRAELRSEFVAQQMDEIPELRTLDGLKYKYIDDRLTRDLEDLERSWQVTRFVVSQRKGKSSNGKNGFKPSTWSTVDVGTYRVETARGSMTR